VGTRPVAVALIAAITPVLAASPLPLDTVGRTDPDMAALAASVRDKPLPERLGAITQAWLGVPYLDGPLGEAGGFDDDPVTRYDAFDCLTFVEEALALALGNDPVDVARVRRGLRYRDGGPATYENRRHFMLAEWIPGTVDDGWLVDATPSFPEAVALSHTVTDQTWAQWSRRSLFSLGDARLPTGTLTFSHLPLTAFAADPTLVERIPDGAVVFTLRVVAPHLPIAITHVGLTVPAVVPTVRHATKIGAPMVKDHKLAWYIDNLGNYTNWPAAGLIILVPQEYGPRR